MPTIRQQKLAKRIVEAMEGTENPTMGEMIREVGYSVTLSKNRPTAVIEAPGVQEALVDYGFTEANAKMVTAEIMMEKESGPMPRLKAAEMTFKVHGSFAPEKSVGVLKVVGETTDPKADALRAEYEAKLLEQMG